MSGSPTTIGFTQEQRDQAQKILDENLRWADYWFDDPENVEKRQEILSRPDQVQTTERDPDALSFQKERAWDARRSVDADRRSLIQPLVDQEKALREAVAKLRPRADQGGSATKDRSDCSPKPESARARQAVSVEAAPPVRGPVLTCSTP